MSTVIYILCALTAGACAVLLLRSYLRSKRRLLLWCGLCFSGMFINNVLLIVDRLIWPDVDLQSPRLAIALVALLPMLYGLVRDE